MEGESLVGAAWCSAVIYTIISLSSIPAVKNETFIIIISLPPPTCQEQLPFSTRGYSQPFWQIPGGRGNLWRTKVGCEAPELQTGSGWGTFRVLSCVFSPVHAPWAIVRCRIPGRRVCFPVPVSSTYPVLTGRAAQPSTSASSQLGSSACSGVWREGWMQFFGNWVDTASLHIMRSLCWIFPITFWPCCFILSTKINMISPRYCSFLASSRGCRWQLLVKECGWQPSKG